MTLARRSVSARDKDRLRVDNWSRSTTTAAGASAGLTRVLVETSVSAATRRFSSAANATCVTASCAAMAAVLAASRARRS